MKKLYAILFPVLVLGCSALTGEEIGRLPINAVSKDTTFIVKETTLSLKKGDEIGLWSDMDIEYTGDVGMAFILELWKDSVKMERMEINPTVKHITLGEVRTNFNGQTDWSFTGKNTSIVIKEDGTYTFKGIFVTSGNPSLKVIKAELVLKK